MLTQFYKPRQLKPDRPSITTIQKWAISSIPDDPILTVSIIQTIKTFKDLGVSTTPCFRQCPPSFLLSLLYHSVIMINEYILANYFWRSLKILYKTDNSQPYRLYVFNHWSTTVFHYLIINIVFVLFIIISAFNWKRIVLRTCIFLLEFFIVETFPHFAIVTSLTGGIFLAGLSMVAPIFIHLKLRMMETADDPDEA